MQRNREMGIYDLFQLKLELNKQSFWLSYIHNRSSNFFIKTEQTPSFYGESA